MSNLSQRLKDGLIGEDDTGSVSSYESIQTDALNSLREKQRQALKPTIATIEADLKGLMPERRVQSLDGSAGSGGQWCLTCNHYKDCCNCAVYNQAIDEITAAIEHYTRDKA